MARWYGDDGAIGRKQRDAMLTALHHALAHFPAAVLLVRTHPLDDEFDTLAVESGDPAVCEALIDEYASLLPDGAGEEDGDE